MTTLVKESLFMDSTIHLKKDQSNYKLITFDLEVDAECVNFELMDNKSFGKLIQEYREKRGLKQAELARRANLSPTYISNLERDSYPSAKSGKGRPSIKVVDNLSRILSIPLEKTRLAAGYAPPEYKETEYLKSPFARLYQKWLSLTDERDKQHIITMLAIHEQWIDTRPRVEISDTQSQNRKRA
ncbi:MAG: helix-turn-helix transcriptional regulator [Acidobacteriota bacterium]